ncbi:hypothetical protein B0A48_11698 [Cryoendolithus antarcticus]|uniref:Peptide chain release factor domain-containing protein n=1 Tax=Cryoendolithus antarcticus TaxID=1507870 RepID=A0A1V8SSM7_9PEZI|nr:hypothetical protein B0A48_11698 [Cryoendolithus antarcticus]
MARGQTSVASHGLTPALVTRARAISDEHTDLTSRLASDFDASAAKKLGQLARTSSALKEYEQAQSALGELQSLLSSSDEELRQLAEDDVEPSRERLANAIRDLKASLIPEHPFAHLPCLIEIRPGAGGDEAAIFAGDLLRMYQAYCARNDLRTALMKYETADGIVDSPGAYAEGSQDMGESSFNDPNSDYYVRPADVKTDFMRAQGAGGQHVNTTDSACRLTHLPTGMVVAIQDSRSQPKNREKAWSLLRARIAQMRREEREAEIVNLRRGAGAGKVGRENKVRTYNWSQQRVSDHRSGFDLRNLDNVMEGGEALDRVMDSVRTWMSEQEVLGLVAEDEEKTRSGKPS